jgi:hypothetical protein
VLVQKSKIDAVQPPWRLPKMLQCPGLTVKVNVIEGCVESLETECRARDLNSGFVYSYKRG